ncbi:hypothetical protein BDZ94DRAFT_1270978 [Collybia nuda]|uniref:Uncharacterized protein n=1 Tax=Collybia nuda TaxID=64659 RepID=A0A9P5XX40_9AGAR|nr:hypothetical protein BDZ94DRAFT_1270978 [Collybia nuda]
MIIWGLQHFPGNIAKSPKWFGWTGYMSGEALMQGIVTGLVWLLISVAFQKCM